MAYALETKILLADKLKGGRPGGSGRSMLHIENSSTSKKSMERTWTRGVWAVDTMPRLLGGASNEQLRTLEVASFKCYFEYFNSGCDMVIAEKHAARNQEDVEVIINYLRLPESLTKTRANLRSSLVAAHYRFHGYTDAQLDNSIDLAVRLFLTIDIRSHRLQSISAASKTSWRVTESFHDFLSDRLPERRTGSKRLLTKHFIACNLKDTLGFLSDGQAICSIIFGLTPTAGSIFIITLPF